MGDVGVDLLFLFARDIFGARACVDYCGPLIAHLGYDPVHFGIVTIMLLVLGSVTPPVGILAMVACKIAGITYSQSFRMLAPFTLVWLLVILLVAYIPGLVLLLPRIVNN